MIHDIGPNAWTDDLWLAPQPGNNSARDLTERGGTQKASCADSPTQQDAPAVCERGNPSPVNAPAGFGPFFHAALNASEVQHDHAR